MIQIQIFKQFDPQNASYAGIAVYRSCKEIESPLLSSCGRNAKIKNYIYLFAIADLKPSIDTGSLTQNHNRLLQLDDEIGFRSLEFVV